MTTDVLYEQDFITWTELQASALRDAARRGDNAPVDWELVAEEIEDLGKEVRNKVRSLTRQIEIHLLKIACSPATDQRAHWMSEVDEFRAQLAQQLADNRALRSRYAALADDELGRAFKAVDRVFRRFGETAALPQLEAWRQRGISADEVLDEELFPEPDRLGFRREPG